ncbi:MAG TPA: hypothetical protein VK485_07970 [Sphingomicrobium sp.]|nr:hypothetical protein [Sphingomicrobium sp.]
MTDQRARAGTALPIIRSIFAVVAGFATVVILSTGTDQIMHALGVIPPGSMWNPWHNALALAYRCLFTIAGGYVTAKLAPRSPMAHVLVLALLGIAGGVAGVVTTAGLNLGPRWYPIALAVTAFPCVWFGGWLYQRARGRR